VYQWLINKTHAFMNNAMLPAYGADEFKTKPIGIETVVYKMM